MPFWNMTASDMVVNIRCNISLEKMNILEISLEMKKKNIYKASLKETASASSAWKENLS